MRAATSSGTAQKTSGSTVRISRRRTGASSLGVSAHVGAGSLLRGLAVLAAGLLGGRLLARPARRRGAPVTARARQQHGAEGKGEGETPAGLGMTHKCHLFVRRSGFQPDRPVRLKT